MALYREHKVNPLAGCWPMLVQYPVIFSVFYVVMNHKALFQNQDWFVDRQRAHARRYAAGALRHQPILAASLADSDILLILLYALSMYLSVRYVSMPATDPQQAQMQRMMAVILAPHARLLGLRAHWPSAMVLYWFAYNVFTMGQQFYMLRRYHQPLALIDSEHVITDAVPPAHRPEALRPRLQRAATASAKSKRPQSGRSKRKNKRGT